MLPLRLHPIAKKFWIDAEGKIRDSHFVESNYQETELAIQSLLEEAGRDVTPNSTSVTMDTPGKNKTPETYLGSDRMERFLSPERVTGEKQVFTTPPILRKHDFAYSGSWKVESERALASSKSTLTLRFEGKKVFLVLAPPENTLSGSGSVKVFLDQKLIPKEVSGKDVVDGKVTLDAERLYELFDGREMTEEHLLHLEFETPGTAVYAFTFS